MQIQLSRIDLPKHDLRASIDEDALDELAASLRDHGQLQPIGVTPTDNSRYEVVFGSRRTRAAQILGWVKIEANIVTDIGLINAAAKKLIENVQRADLTPIEEAYGLINLVGEATIDLRKLQQLTGKSRDWIRTRLELADLPDDLQGAVQAGVLGVGVARAFGQIQNPEVREQYLKAAVENGCTADQAKIWASQAQFAESGIMSMDQIQQSGLEATAPPQVVDQQYSCFICAQTHSWRRVNTLVVCGTCQEAIGSTREKNPAESPPPPLDTDHNL